MTPPDYQSTFVRALALQREAAAEGFDWAELGPMWEKLAEEVGELRDAIAQGEDRPTIEGELGDILFMVVNIARQLELDPDAALEGCNKRFSKRYDDVRRQLAERGIEIGTATLAEMEACWELAKRAERNASRSAVTVKERG